MPDAAGLLAIMVAVQMVAGVSESSAVDALLLARCGSAAACTRDRAGSASVRRCASAAADHGRVSCALPCGVKRVPDSFLQEARHSTRCL